MSSKFEDEAADLLGSPRAMADAATLATAMRDGTFPETFATMLRRAFGFPYPAMVEIGRAVERALRSRSDDAKARRLGRAAAKLSVQHFGREVALDDPRNDGYPLEQFLRAIFDAVAMYNRLDQNPCTAPFPTYRIAGYLVGAAKVLTDMGVVPSRAAIVTMAHTVLCDDGISCSKGDVELVFEKLIQGRSLRAWLEMLSGEAAAGSARLN